MAELNSKFQNDDLETLIDAMADWEAMGNQEFYVMNLVKSMPVPDEEHEAHDYVFQIKDHFRQREKSILEGRANRQEKATFLKAKLMMARRELGINQLFDMAATSPADLPKTAPPVEKQVTTSADHLQPARAAKIEEKKADCVVATGGPKLEDAEFFIKDLGVWEHYQKFLAERKAASAS